MAIRGDLVGGNGVPYENQYIRVATVYATKHSLNIVLDVFFEAPNEGDFPHIQAEHNNVPYDMLSEGTLWQKAYDAIKPWYPTAVDC